MDPGVGEGGSDAEESRRSLDGMISACRILRNPSFSSTWAVRRLKGADF